MADTRLRKVSDEDELHDKIDDYQIQGFHVTERTDRHARLRNNSYGTVGMHIIWFLFTFLLTLGIGNILYAVYAYVSKSDEVLVKIED